MELNNTLLDTKRKTCWVLLIVAAPRLSPLWQIMKGSNNTLLVASASHTTVSQHVQHRQYPLTSRLKGGHNIPTDRRRSDSDSVGLVRRVVLDNQTSRLGGEQGYYPIEGHDWRGEMGSGQSASRLRGC